MTTDSATEESDTNVINNNFYILPDLLVLLIYLNIVRRQNFSLITIKSITENLRIEREIDDSIFVSIKCQFSVFFCLFFNFEMWHPDLSVL